MPGRHSAGQAQKAHPGGLLQKNRHVGCQEFPVCLRTKGGVGRKERKKGGRLERGRVETKQLAGEGTRGARGYRERRRRKLRPQSSALRPRETRKAGGAAHLQRGCTHQSSPGEEKLLGAELKEQEARALGPRLNQTRETRGCEICPHHNPGDCAGEGKMPTTGQREQGLGNCSRRSSALPAPGGAVLATSLYRPEHSRWRAAAADKCLLNE